MPISGELRVRTRINYNKQAKLNLNIKKHWMQSFKLLGSLRQTKRNSLGEEATPNFVRWKKGMGLYEGKTT